MVIRTGFGALFEVNAVCFGYPPRAIFFCLADGPERGERRSDWEGRKGGGLLSSEVVSVTHKRCRFPGGGISPCLEGTECIKSAQVRLGGLGLQPKCKNTINPKYSTKPNRRSGPEGHGVHGEKVVMPDSEHHSKQELTW